MAVPDFQSMMLPILQMAAKGPINTSETVGRISDYFHLTDEDRKEILPSGKQTRVANRVYWAFIDLAKANLLQRESRGVYGITDEGRKVLDEKHDRIDVNFLMNRSDDFRKFYKRDIDQPKPPIINPVVLPVVDTQEVGTPEERIYSAFEELDNALQSDLQKRLQTMNDDAFERLIIEVMLGLGYGAGGLAKRTGGPGDGAIDGIITEDVFGLDVIYLQAKRYNANSGVGADKIREFAGAMDAYGIIKGVFVTTSHYTKAAKEFAERSPKRLRLIDGNELAQLMIKHNIGVRRDRLLELKKIDDNFFEEL